MNTVEVTTLYCSDSGAAEGETNSTHHLVPRGSIGAGRSMTCRYCGKTEKQLRSNAS